jgi:hypothetical protein
MMNGSAKQQGDQRKGGVGRGKGPVKPEVDEDREVGGS